MRQMLRGAVVAVVACTATLAAAVDYTWDATPATTGPQDGAGTWSTSASGTNWWNGTSNIAWPNLSTDTAVFGAASGAAGTVTVSNVTTNGLTFNAPGSGTYTLSSGTITLAGASPTITANVAATIGSVLAGSAGMVKAGAGTLTLSAANTYSGGSQINAGAVVATNSNAFGGGTITLGSSGTASLTAPAAGNTYTNAVSGSGVLILASGNGNNTTVARYSGDLSGFTGTFRLTSQGDYLGIDGNYLSGSNARWEVNNGGIGYVASGAGTIVAIGELSGTGRLGSNYNQATTWEVGALATSSTFGGVLVNALTGGGAGGTNLRKVGAGTLTLTGSNLATGSTTIVSGTLAVAGSGVLGNGAYAAGISNAGSLVFSTSANQTLSGTVSGAGMLIQQGSGTLTLSASNTYTGGTRITGGAVVASNVLAFGSGTITLGASGTASLQGLPSATYSNTVSGSGVLILASGAGDNTTVARYSGDLSGFTGTVRITSQGDYVGIQGNYLSGSNARWEVNNGGPGYVASGSGTVVAIGQLSGTGRLGSNFNQATTWEVGALATSSTFGGVFVNALAGGGAGGTNLRKVGAGTLTLTNSSTATGTLTVAAGVLQLGSGGNAGSFTFGTLTGSAGATLAFNRSDAITQGTQFTSVIGGALNVSQLGSGTVTLTGANTYTGTTRLQAGALALATNGSFANSPLIIVGGSGSSGVVLDLTAKTGSFAFTSGQTVGGIGTTNIGAGKTVTVAGIWAPGNSIGSNAVTGNLTLSGTSQFELGTPGTSTTAPGLSDLTAVSGTLTLGGVLNLIDNAGADGNGSVAGGVYRLFTYGNAVSGSYASVTNPSATTRTSLGNIVYAGSGTAAGNGVFLSIYNLASATTAQTVNVGNMYAGSTKTAAVTLTNSAPTNATYTETLSTGGFTSTSANFTATGSATGIAGGSSGSGDLLVGLGSGLSAGAVSGTTTLALFSNAVNASGLAQQSIAAQTITITGTVWNAAAVNSITTPVSIGSVRVGGTFAASGLTITNTAAVSAFTELLGATATTTGLASTSGSVSALAGGSTSTSLLVGLGGSANTATAGVKSGLATVSFTSTGGPGTASIASQNVTVTGTVWNYAAASIDSGTTVNFGTVLKNTTLTQSLSITNSAPNDGFSEELDAAFGSPTGLATGSGSFGLLSADSTSTAMSVSLASGSAGTATGSVPVNFTSNGDGTSGLGAASLGSQTVSLSATILDPAVASFKSGSTSTSLLLNFGTVNQGATVTPLGFNLWNIVQTAGYTADLAYLGFVSGTGNDPAISTNLALFDNLASGTFNSWQASLSTATMGTFVNTYTLEFKSANDNIVFGSDTSQYLTLTVQGIVVVPEPGAIALAAAGLGAIAVTRRRRRTACGVTAP